MKRWQDDKMIRWHGDMVTYKATSCQKFPKVDKDWQKKWLTLAKVAKDAVAVAKSS